MAPRRRAPTPMTRLALLLTLAALAVAPARAQARFDLTLGPTVNWIGDVAALRVDPTAPQAPVADTLQFSPSVGLQAGLGLSLGRGPLAVRAGARLATTGPVFDAASGFDQDALALNVLTVGIDAQFRRAVGPVELVAFGGPELRYAVDLSGAEGAGGAVREFRESVEPLSAAAVVGAGLQFRAFGTSVGPELRYALGLSDVSGGEFSQDGATVRLEDGLRLRQLAFGLVFGR